MRNSRGFRKTQAGWAIKILRKTPPTASSPSASPYTTAKSSGSCSVAEQRDYWQGCGKLQGSNSRNVTLARVAGLCSLK